MEAQFIEPATTPLHNCNQRHASGPQLMQDAIHSFSLDDRNQDNHTASHSDIGSKEGQEAVKANNCAECSENYFNKRLLHYDSEGVTSLGTSTSVGDSESLYHYSTIGDLDDMDDIRSQKSMQSIKSLHSSKSGEPIHSTRSLLLAHYNSKPNHDESIALIEGIVDNDALLFTPKRRDRKSVKIQTPPMRFDDVRRDESVSTMLTSNSFKLDQVSDIDHSLDGSEVDQFDYSSHVPTDDENDMDSIAAGTRKLGHSNSTHSLPCERLKISSLSSSHYLINQSGSRPRSMTFGGGELAPVAPRFRPKLSLIDPTELNLPPPHSITTTVKSAQTQFSFAPSALPGSRRSGDMSIDAHLTKLMNELLHIHD